MIAKNIFIYHKRKSGSPQATRSSRRTELGLGLFGCAGFQGSGGRRLTKEVILLLLKDRGETESQRICVTAVQCKSEHE